MKILFKLKIGLFALFMCLFIDQSSANVDLEGSIDKNQLDNFYWLSEESSECAPVSRTNIIWYGDTDKDYLDSFYRLSKESGENASVSVTNVSGQGKVWKVNKPAGSKRAELARTNGWIPSEGEKVYIGWKMKVNIAGSENPDGYAVYQLKSESPHSQNYPISMGYNGNKLTVDAYNAGSGSQASRRRTLCEKNVSENSWVYIVLGIKFSHNANIGYVEVWLNGQKQNLLNDNSNKQAKHRTLDDNGNYCKWGAYNEESRRFNITTHLDEMRVAKTYSEANPYTHESGEEPDDNDIDDYDISGIYKFKNVATGKYLDSDGKNLKVSTISTGQDKQWKVVKIKDSYYNIDCQFNGRGILDSNPSGVVLNSIIESPNSDRDKQWKAISLGNNLYRFNNKFSDRGYLSANTSTNKISYSSSIGDDTKWSLEFVSSLKSLSLDADKVNLDQDGIEFNYDLLALDFEVTEFSSDLEALRVFPNPATETFKIVLKDFENANVTIYNMGGQLIYQELASNKIIQLSKEDGFVSGIYLIKVITKNQRTYNKKIVIL